MNIEERVKLALDTHHQGYNCVQAVIAGYLDVLDISKKDAMKMGYGLRGGLGMMREVCGTLIGAGMVMSHKYGKEEADPKLKMEIYKKVAALGMEFEEIHGSVVCGELLGLRETDKKVNKKSCDELIEEVVRLLVKYIIE